MQGPVRTPPSTTTEHKTGSIGASQRESTTLASNQQSAKPMTSTSAICKRLSRGNVMTGQIKSSPQQPSAVQQLDPLSAPPHVRRWPVERPPPRLRPRAAMQRLPELMRPVAELPRAPIAELPWPQWLPPAARARHPASSEQLSVSGQCRTKAACCDKRSIAQQISLCWARQLITIAGGWCVCPNPSASRLWRHVAPWR